MWIKKYIIGFLGAIFISLGASSQDIFIDGTNSSLGGFICGESHTIQLSDPQYLHFLPIDSPMICLLLYYLELLYHIR